MSSAAVRPTRLAALAIAAGSALAFGLMATPAWSADAKPDVPTASADAAALTAPFPAPSAVFFDDFDYPNPAALFQHGWTARTVAGHPGIPGARWAPEGVSLVDDPQQRGGRWLRLRASTDGTGAGTSQVQLCHQRKYLTGTYAARVRFSDEPVSGADGDPVIQTFYAVSPLRFDFDPEFSELDWEYLPNGGWGSDKTRLYGITWQTVRLDPWLAFNQQHEEFGALGRRGQDMHTLVIQVADGQTRWFLDGRPISTHGGRNYPVVPMSINFNLWFSPNGPLPQGGAPRVYEQEVDWVLHAKDQVLSPAEVDAQVSRWRASGVKRLDTVPAAQPALESRCDV